jgi:hypothetical protein
MTAKKETAEKKEVQEPTFTHDKTLNIHQRILLVMREVGYIQKEEKKVNNQYRFVSHDAVVGEVRPSMLRHGIIVEPRIIESKLKIREIITEKNERKIGYVAQVKMEFDFVNVDDPKDRITAPGIGMGIDPQDKATGKAMSYAKKYALLNALLLETGDDPERDVNYSLGSKQAEPAAQPAFPRDKQYSFVVNTTTALGTPDTSAHYRTNYSKVLSSPQYARLDPDLKAMIDADVITNIGKTNDQDAAKTTAPESQAPTTNQGGGNGSEPA